MNLSSATLPNGIDDDEESKSLHSRIALSGWFGFVAVVGFIGNLLIFIVVVMYPKLRTITNVYVTSLAMADMLTCLIIPFIIVGVVSTTGWPFSEASCVFVAVINFACNGASVWHLAIIGFNRMVLITMKASTYRKIFSKVNVVLFLIVTWLIPLSVILVPFLGGFTRLGYDDGPHLCTDIEDNEDGSENQLHSYLQATTLTCIPLALVLLFYARIYVHVRQHERGLNKWKNTSTKQTPAAAVPATVTSQTLTPVAATDATVPDAVKGTSQAPSTSATISTHPTAAAQNKGDRQKSLEYRITKNTFYVVLGFLLCVIPYGICILGQYGPGGTPLALAFLLFNSCINPLIYGTKHPQFKSSLRNLFRGRFSAPLVTSNSVGPSEQ